MIKTKFYRTRIRNQIKNKIKNLEKNNNLLKSRDWIINAIN
jgi:hypothetical protein